VLEGVAQEPGASNREVAVHAGIQDAGQVSKLLARLERLGLIANGSDSPRKGEPNAWKLTATGATLARSLSVGGADPHAWQAA
jgi:predicted transcriptional regulator